MKITKNSGDVVDYNPAKLKASLLKSGASIGVVESILQTIEKEMYPGIATKHIYKRAFGLLKKIANYHAARYNLKEAIRMLGPAGFFFEKYIARLFASENFQTVTNLTLQGKCVTHEIDVLIKKEAVIAMVECKFHAGRDVTTDVKIPMYILSRFNDLKEIRHTIFKGKELVSKCWIATNNRFTSDAIAFSKCMGLHLISWDYPEKNNLKTKNDIDFLYPITCLTTLSLAEKEKLLILDVILVKELFTNSSSLEKIGISINRKKNILKEASELCK